MSTRKHFERLPINVQPVIYDLSLNPDLNSFTFSGKETILLKITKATSKIVLNCLDLVIKLVEIRFLPTDRILTPDFVISVEDETLTLQFPEALPVGDAELLIEFNGELNDKMKGFYRSKYIKTAGDEEKYFAVTQFAATDARRCFPCWDEPAIKARFDVTLIVDFDKVALSNMPVKEEGTSETGQKMVKFTRTPVMSTYLVAFLVGNFEYVEDTSADGILIRIYTPPGKKEHGRFALHVAVKVLPYYKEYFGIAYPLPKMDLVAVSEIAPSAMENWGLVTFRESCILVDDSNTSVTTRQTVAVIVGHELAHQWFGNLVTMEWWTDIWLNEGYASFVEFLCVAYLFPEYDIWSQFVPRTFCRALELDSLRNSHPIEVPVNHPAEVDEIFDDISYKKGGSVIRMLHHFIGDEDFRKGMNLYLTRHKYGNTRTEDLWAALEEASSKPIKAIMPTWTKQMGFPVITVESSTQEADTRIIVVSQKNFNGGDLDENESLWLVPLSFCKESKPSEVCFSTLLEDRRTKVSIPDVAPNEWVKLNPGAIGFYRTKYFPEMLNSFTPAVEQKQLPPLDRLNLLDDLFALVLAGETSTVQALDLICGMKEEDNYVVWANMASCLEKMHNLLSNTEFVDSFNMYGLQTVKPIYNQLGYECRPDEDHFSTLLRSLILNLLIKFGGKEFVKVAKKKFEDHCRGENTIPADLRTVVYKAAISANGRKAFDSLLNLYRATDSQEEKSRILLSFSGVTDINLVDDILQFSQSNEVDPSSAVVVIISVAASKVGRDKSWQFVKENYENFYEKFAGGFLLWRLLKQTMENYASEEKAAEIESFFSTKKVSGVDRTIQQSLETIRNNAAWLKRDGEVIRDYLEKLR